MLDLATCYDVAVLGGGLCGYGAARRLALSGAKVLLVERRPVLGWELTWAFHTELGEPTCEAARWLRDAMTAAGGCRDGILDPPIAEMLLDRGATAAGLQVLLYAQAVAVSRQDDRLSGVILGTKSGEVAVRARAFVDATDNGLVWRLAGGSVRGTDGASGELCVFLNGVPDRPDRCVALPGTRNADGVSVQSTLWPGEVAARFRVEGSDVRGARCALPEVLGVVRGQPYLPEEAVVTSVGAELYPMGAVRLEDLLGRSLVDAGNLFAGGAWAVRRTEVIDDTPGRPRGLTVSERLAIGEQAAGAVQAALPSLGAPTKEEAVPHSRVAPPEHEADVVVCGGGTGGAFAAIAAARQGAKTVLLDAGTGLGGVGTGGGIHSYYHGVTGGLQDEADARLAELTPLFGPPDKVQGFHPWAKQVVLEQMAHEAGAEVIYHTMVTGVRTEPVPSELPAPAGDRTEPVRRLTAVVAAGPEGNALYHAKAFVDGTGDGDVAAMAGASVTLGREADGLPHAYSLPAGRLGDDGKLLITNFDAGYCDPTDAADITRARRRALQHYWHEKFEASSRFLYIAPVLGLRNSRLVEGDYRITLLDEVTGRQFSDVVAYAFSHFDNHGFDYENESDEAMLWVWMLGNWGRRIGCEIPYRALLPRGIEGLLMGCRALSMTHDAHNQLRMQRDLQRVGEAAGIAAALAAKRRLAPRELPVEELQAALLQSGALGPRETPRLPAPEAKQGIHDASWLPAQPPALPASQWAAKLGTEGSPQATWELLRKGDAALPLLLEATKSEAPSTRFWGSVALAMLRRPEAAAELRACLAERRDEEREGRKTAPLWQGAAVLLGRIGDREAVSELAGVLADPEASLDALIAVVRALGRIGDPAAVSAIETMLARDDLPTERRLQVSVATVNEVVEDARWQLELAAAEALVRLGSPRPELAERHVGDERALVRRHARHVAELSRGS